MNFHPISVPRPIHASAPKIASVHVAKVGGGFKVQHMMTHGPRQVPFVFSDPAKMRQHIAKISAGAWRSPDRNVAGAIDKTMNLGPTV